MAPSTPADHLERAEQALGARYRLERVIAANNERVLFVGIDRALNRRVSIRVNFYFDDPTRTWFLREAEALAQLDHPAIRHVYDVAVVGDVAYRVGNWVEGESLLEAAQRGPRLIPTVHTLARDLLSALEHCHAAGLLIRRIVPASIVLSQAGRGTITDLRFCSAVLSAIPAGVRPTGLAFMAPEIRDGSPGESTCDMYTAGAVLYFAVTGQEPALDPDAVRRPTEIRPTCPRTIERIVLRALRADPDRRYLTATEMLEDFASDAGSFDVTPMQPGSSGANPLISSRTSEKALRRALGDDYELLEPVGRGGFGRVYRVRDLHLEREVALKVLDPELTRDPSVVERFRREAQLAAKLSHPNIVDIYDIQSRAGLIWYTMELVRGPNLAQLVEREGPLPVSRVIRLLRESLGALAQAHALGLVHRDVKPENLLIAPGGAVKITDFGLALALRGQGRFGGATSQSGTPQFASPEQLLGERVDQRSDLYSTAAAAYFALLGRPPFGGHTPEQVLARQTTDQFPELATERPDVPAALARVLERALTNDVNKRYASALDFLQAINKVTRRSLRQRGVGWLQRLVARLERGSP
jgi:eukaryotic-like serine/threonine-protein kinase